MLLLAADTLRGDEIRLLQDLQVLGHRLPRHVEPLAQIAERLPIARVQPIEQPAPACVGQCTKHQVIAHVALYATF